MAFSAFVALVFLAPILEILRPKDKGPRKILKKPLRRLIWSRTLTAFNSEASHAQNACASGDLVDVCMKAGVEVRRMGNDTVRFLGDVIIPPRLVVYDNIVVEGVLTIGDDCVLHRSAKAYGNIRVGNGVVINGNLVSKLNVEMMDNVVVAGSLHAEGSVRLGERVFVGSAVVAGADVELYENSEVKKNILTNGVIRVLRCPRVDLPSTLPDIG